MLDIVGVSMIREDRKMRVRYATVTANPTVEASPDQGQAKTYANAINKPWSKSGV